MVLECAGDFVANDVAQYPAEHASDDAHQHRDHGRHLQLQCLVQTRGCKQPKAECIRPLDRALGHFEVASAQKQHRQNANRQDAPQHFDMTHPEERPLVQKQVAKSPATECGQESDCTDPDCIHPLSRRLKNA